MSSGALFSIQEFVQACPLLQKGLGHLAALYLLLLLVARYKLSYHKTICYHLFSTCGEYLAGNRLSFPSTPRSFDTLTYRKDYDRSPILVGHQLAIQVWREHRLCKQVNSSHHPRGETDQVCVYACAKEDSSKFTLESCSVGSASCEVLSRCIPGGITRHATRPRHRVFD